MPKDFETFRLQWGLVRRYLLQSGLLRWPWVRGIITIPTVMRDPSRFLNRRTSAHSLFWLLLLLLGSGCRQDGGRNASSAPPIAPPDPWVITDHNAANLNPVLLWNGLLGMRFLPRGDREIYSIENYEPSGEEKLRKWSEQTSGMIMVGETFISPVAGNGFRQSLDLKTGICDMQWEQQDSQAGYFFVQARFSVSPNRAITQEVWTIRPELACTISIARSRASAGTPRPIEGQFQNEYELNVNGKRLLVREKVDGSSASGWNPDQGYSWQGTVAANTPLTFERIVLDPSAIPGSVTNIDVEAESKAHWVQAWETDIEIDGPVEDQQFLRSALFYLRSSIHPTGQMSVSPMGLSSNIYNGHVFWDADIWVFPALALIDPQRAKVIPEYRLRLARHAMQNHVNWLVAGKPIGNGKLLGKPIHPDDLKKMELPVAAKFPWESSVSGKETVPGPSRFQDHITGSVAWSVDQAASLGLADRYRAEALRALAKRFYDQRSTIGEAGLREIKGTMSPDENHIGDNDLYTNLLAMWCQSDGHWPPKPSYKLPRDAQSFLTYEKDGLRGYKQAAAVLSIWPLQYPSAEAQAKVMMERFAGKVTKNGPAMSDSVHALIWARLGDKDKAYQAWHASWKPFVKSPFLLFSEKRNSARTYFTTGAAGSLNAVIYGFAGIRVDDKKAPNARWSTPLLNGKVLSIAPNLPKEWKSLRLKGLKILGKPYSIEITGDQVKVS